MDTPILAKPYLNPRTRRPVINPNGWFLSEKYDGERAIWTGARMISRSGSAIELPTWFKELLPQATPLDGELWIGRGKFNEIGHLRKRDLQLRSWKVTKYMVFDTPDRDQLKLEDRFLKIHLICQRIQQQWLEFRNTSRSLGQTDPMIPEECPINAVLQIKINGGVDEVEQHYQRIISGGGEGIILREPGSWYTNTRSTSFLKYKRYHECEAVISDYKPGNGRNLGRLGSFCVHPINSEGYPNRRVTFHVAGVNDTIRINYRETHPIGTIITMIFTEYTKELRPRHPRFKGTRGFLDLNDPYAKWTPDLHCYPIIPVECISTQTPALLQTREFFQIPPPIPQPLLRMTLRKTHSAPNPQPPSLHTNVPNPQNAVLNIVLKTKRPVTTLPITLRIKDNASFIKH